MVNKMLDHPLNYLRGTGVSTNEVSINVVVWTIIKGQCSSLL